jgi:1-acyl-sn-glycerol-3-phosphate acyltransferase
MNAWQYSPAADLNQTLAQRWATAGREPDVLCHALRSAGAVAIRTSLATYFRMRIHGREHLPARGSFVLVANHASHLDALCLLSALPISRLHHAFPAAAADYFFQSPAAGALSGVFINALPFARKGHVRQTLTACRKLLAADGNVLILFPEGTRSTTGEIGTFKGGVGELVAGTDVPIVPCYLDGAHRAWPKGRWLPRPRKLTLTIGEPMTFAHLERGRQSSAQIAQETERAVRALAHQTIELRNTNHERHPRPQRGTPALALAAAGANLATC